MLTFLFVHVPIRLKFSRCMRCIIIGFGSLSWFRVQYVNISVLVVSCIVHAWIKTIPFSLKCASVFVGWFSSRKCQYCLMGDLFLPVYFIDQVVIIICNTSFIQWKIKTKKKKNFSSLCCCFISTRLIHGINSLRNVFDAAHFF